MLRRLTLIVIVGLALLLATSSVQAGGWATVTLDSAPTNIQAGRLTRIGFMVLQHGKTPIDSFGSEQLKPYLTARHKASGTSLKVDAKKLGPTGHFEVEVTFYKDGAWDWEITPLPFAGTKFESITVLPAPVDTGARQAREMTAAQSRQTWLLLLGMVLAVVALWTVMQRRELYQWLLARTGRTS
jgi:hypothetical protein